MKSYILSIIGTAILSAIANTVSPEQWRKYMKIITGLVVVSILLSPLSNLFHVDIFSDFAFSQSELNQNTQREAVARELQSRINSDIEERIKKEFYIECRAEAALSLNDAMLIQGVGQIRLSGFSGDRTAVRNRLSEVYGVPPGEVVFQ